MVSLHEEEGDVEILVGGLELLLKLRVCGAVRAILVDIVPEENGKVALVHVANL